MVLVILAAGFGSRYGGLKQVDVVSGENEAIIDFSIYDAIRNGFTKVVFVVREDILETMKNLYNTKLNGNIAIDFVCQKITAIPSEFSNNYRIKPWGTAHALLTVKNVVNDNFCVINADDFYGNEAFLKIANFLKNTSNSSNQYAMVGFQIQNTLSQNGTVSRGECKIDTNNSLKEVIERTNITSVDDQIVYIENDLKKEIEKDTLVSMNFWGFTPTIFKEMDMLFYQFLEQNYLTEKKEFYLPAVVNFLLEKKKASVKILKTTANWMGVTYKEDKETVATKISELKRKGIYPQSLWN